MSIFNTSHILTIGDIYNLDDITYRVFLSDDDILTRPENSQLKTRYKGGKLFELCSISTGNFGDFFEGMSPGEFTDKFVKSFQECEIGSLYEISKQLREKTSINHSYIHFIKNFERGLKWSGALLPWRNQAIIQHSHTPTDKKIQLALNFPAYVLNAFREYLDKGYQLVLLYTYDYTFDCSSPSIRCIVFPLIPKDGYEDVFKSLE